MSTRTILAMYDHQLTDTARFDIEHAVITSQGLTREESLLLLAFLYKSENETDQRVLDIEVERDNALDRIARLVRKLALLEIELQRRDEHVA